ncbi:MAG: cytochrome ubiquinol oxidase subunit I [Nitrososphaerota archaeon]
MTVKLALVDNLLTVGTASQILQNPAVAKAVGISLNDPYIALSSPYALASVLHNVTAAVIIGIALAAAALGYKHFKTGDPKYVKLLKSFIPILLVLLIIQPIVFGDNMGKAVASFMPTKFAMMEGAETTIQNPIVAFLAYGDPSRPIYGFDEFRRACEKHKDLTIADVVHAVVPGYKPGPSGDIRLLDLCLQDLAKAEARLSVINSAYYTKIAAGVMALVSVVALSGSIYNLGPISRVVRAIERSLGGKNLLFLLTLLTLLGSIFASALGWYVREVGRKPWTVYGLLYPEELVTPVAISTPVMVAFTVIFTATALGGIYGIYLVAARPLEFVKLLRRGAGVEE